MKTTSINVLLAAGAVAQLASAQPHVHGHNHKRDAVTVTNVDVAYTTVVQWVTVGAPVATTASKIKTGLRNKGHTRKQTSSTTETSTSTSATPVQTTLATYSSAAKSSSLSAYSSAKSKSSKSSSVVSSSAAPKATSSTGLAGYTGVKAGLSGYISIQETDAWSSFAPHIGWYSDYSATTPDANGVQGIPMVSRSTVSLQKIVLMIPSSGVMAALARRSLPPVCLNSTMSSLLPMHQRSCLDSTSRTATAQTAVISATHLPVSICGTSTSSHSPTEVPPWALHPCALKRTRHGFHSSLA